MVWCKLKDFFQIFRINCSSNNACLKLITIVFFFNYFEGVINVLVLPFSHYQPLLKIKDFCCLWCKRNPREYFYLCQTEKHVSNSENEWTIPFLITFLLIAIWEEKLENAILTKKFSNATIFHFLLLFTKETKHRW